MNTASPLPVTWYMNGRALIGIGCALIIAGCNPGTESRASRIAEPQPVKVERRDIVGYVVVDGRLDVPPGSVATVSPPYRAPVEKVMAAEGQKVRRGEVLFDLSMPEAESNYETMRATVQAAETALANTKARADAPVKELERQLAEARSRERTLREYARTSGDSSQVQPAVDARTAIEQQLVSVRSKRNAAVRPYESQLEQAREALRQAQSGVKQGQVKAPISGTVIDMNVRNGQTVGQDRNEILARIVKLGAIRVKANLEAGEAAVVKDGAHVVVRFVGQEDKPFDGHVTSIRKLPGATTGDTETEVIIDFRNDMGVVKPEMRVASVGIAVGKVERALTVPNEALAQEQSGKYFVHRLENGNWKPVVVVTGLTDGTYTEVQQGLKENDTVQSPIKVDRS